jgi:peptidoglycan/xylan/chitin deacetylase (PgdA/CDA1 family)/folate-dependent phosphoribosylglycinamide formyltransferase PurN
VEPSLRVAFLIGKDDRASRHAIEAVCKLDGIEPVAVLLDTAPTPWKRRLKNFRRNISDNGWTYPLTRILGAVRAKLEDATWSAAVSHDEIQNVLRKAFPDRPQTIDDLGRLQSLPIHRVGNLNEENAARVLAEADVDLGIVLGTRVLKASTFSVPRLGSINLHKGKVPEYRGMPPGFWELYDGAGSAGITVHFVDSKLDTGDVIAESSVRILATDTPETLIQKLHQESVGVLVEAVRAIRDGSATPRPQHSLAAKPRTRPKLRDIKTLRRKLPHWKKMSDFGSIVRNGYVLLAWYGGLYALARAWNRRKRSRAAIYLHHRVNDYSRDVLTVSTEAFAAQLLAISKRYRMVSTREIVEHVIKGTPIAPTAVAIHFDDCYLDVLENGAPILKTLGIQACAFVNSGFLDTERRFLHDERRFPFTYPNLRTADLQKWAELGFEVGSHTVNHVNLAECTAEVVESEVVECGKALASILGHPVEWFSYPYGRLEHISETARAIVRRSGYVAMFSAHGGFLGSRTDPFDIPRLGASVESAPVYCLLELEGLAPNQIERRIKHWATLLTGKRATETPSAMGA